MDSQPARIEEKARVLAEWWAQKLTSTPVHDILGSTRESYPSRERRDAETAEIMGSMLSAQTPEPDDESVKVFVEALTTAIVNEATRSYQWGVEDAKRRGEEPHGRYYCNVSTDYGPDMVLMRALEFAGIPQAGMRLPWKTMTHCDHTGVEVAQGYGAALVDIWNE